MKTKILFSFDCEDYTSDRSTDMLVRMGHALSSNGVTGHFQMVGLLAADIEKKNRRDVIEALAPHRIGYHSYNHSIHPTLMEVTDVEDYGEAVENFNKTEPLGAEIVKRVFGRDVLCSACPPGNSVSYAALYEYAKMGIPVYIGGIFPEQDRPIRFCNAVQIPYNYMIESYLFSEDFDFDAFLDELAGQKLVTIYHHPNMGAFVEFWDSVNYNRTNSVPFGEWMPCRPRTPEATELFYRNFDRFLKALAADDRFEITDLDALVAEAGLPPVIRRADAGKISAMLRERKPPYKNPQSELLLAAAAFLTDPERTEYSNREVYGFLEEPVGAETEMTLTKDELAAAADQIREGEFLPPSIPAGGKTIGPRDYLCAAWEVLAGSETGRVVPQIQTEVPEPYETLRTVCFRGDWIFSDDFEDRFMSKRLRLQAWTIAD